MSVPVYRKAGGAGPALVGSEASPRALADRAVFWAELGLVAAPQLLSRVGQALQDAADDDPELGEAMRLAAQHVASKCLVWQGPVSRGSNGVRLDGQTVWSGVNIDDEETWAESDSNHNREMSSQDSDSESQQGEEARTSHPLVRVIPGHFLLGLLPGLGGFTSTLVWASCLILFAFRWLYSALRGERWYWLADFGLSTKVGTVIRVMTAVRIFAYVPFVVTVSQLVNGDALNRALRAELDRAAGGELRVLVKSMLIGCTMLYVSVMVGQFLLIHAGPDGFRLDLVLALFMKHTIFFVYTVAFMLAWKLSMLRINRLRDRIKLQPSDLAGCWPSFTREYKAIVDLVDELWRGSGLSFAASLVFVLDLLFAAFAIAVAEAEIYWEGWGTWVWIVGQAGLPCASLYLWAKIHDACCSEQHPNQSLMSLAARHLGRVHPQDVSDHVSFVKIVRRLPCGVYVNTFGLISMKRVAPLLRLVSIGIPVFVGVACNYAKYGTINN